MTVSEEGKEEKEKTIGHMGHNEHMEYMEHEAHDDHMAHVDSKGHEDHHTLMLSDLKNRFIISIVLTVPVLLLSPVIQAFLGLDMYLPGSGYILFLLSSVVYFYGGFPILKGFHDEMKAGSPGMK